MKIVIPDDYQDMVDRLECYALIRHHDLVRYREPAGDLGELAARLADADVVVAIRERVEFSRALLERLPKLKLIALVGRNSRSIDLAAWRAQWRRRASARAAFCRSAATGSGQILHRIDCQRCQTAARPVHTQLRPRFAPWLV
jgi:phosphoglycerate dehydrogenase-like enzyme